MSVLLNEKLISMAQAREKFPASRRGRGRVNGSTLWRWIRVGVLLPDGSRLKLEAVRVGQNFLTSEEAINRFIERQNADPHAEPPAVAPRSAGERRRASVRAARELEAVGV